MRLPELNGLGLHGNALRIICLAGLILLVLTGAVLLVFSILGPGWAGSGGRGDSFHRILRDYDLTVRTLEAASGPAGLVENIEKLNHELGRLEDKALGVESWLSVLKRRRYLSAFHPRFAEACRESAHRAARAYPASQPLAAIAAEALVRNMAIDSRTEAELREYLPLLATPAFNTLRLYLHVLLGDFTSPQRLSREKVMEPGPFSSAALFADDPIENFAELEALAVDLALVKLLYGDAQGAAAEMQTAAGYFINRTQDVPHAASFLRFAAEYYYDFGDILRAAELFSQIAGEEALLRQADALWLGGYYDSARAIWSALAYDEILPVAARSLYNLALSAPDTEEAAVFLRRLAEQVPAEQTPGQGSGAAEITGRQFGLILYSRLFESERAIAVLERAPSLPLQGRHFIDLEIINRRAEIDEPGRLAAETWLLLERYPENEELYHWAAWLFERQRNYGEMEILLKRGRRLGFDGQWLAIYEAMDLMREGHLDTAAGILRAIPAETAGWAVSANLGRILDAELAFARALEQYDRALERVQDPWSASRIQLRIARSLRSLGLSGEALRALEYAVELDPDNYNARLELDRMGGY